MISETSFKSWRRVTLLIFYVAIGISLFFIFAYFFRFNYGLSNSHTVWAEFGTYFSGTIGSILSALNLFALIYLTFKLNKGNKQEWLTDLRSPFYKSILETLYSYEPSDIIETKEKQEFKKFKLWLTYLSLENHMFLLTPTLKDKTECFKNELLNALNKLDPESSERDNEFLSNYSRFIQSRSNFTNHLGNIMMNRTTLDLYG